MEEGWQARRGTLAGAIRDTSRMRVDDVRTSCSALLTLDGQVIGVVEVVAAEPVLQPVGAVVVRLTASQLSGSSRVPWIYTVRTTRHVDAAAMVWMTDSGRVRTIRARRDTVGMNMTARTADTHGE